MASNWIHIVHLGPLPTLGRVVVASSQTTREVLYQEATSPLCNFNLQAIFTNKTQISALLNEATSLSQLGAHPRATKVPAMAVIHDDHHRRQTSLTHSSGIAKKVPRANGRAWRHEEEEYLRRARSRAVPYKQIAAYLHKTELACRLHFHQINFSHRRQINLAVDRVDSERSPSPAVGDRAREADTGSGVATPRISVTYSPSPRIAYSASPSMGNNNYVNQSTSIGTEWSSASKHRTNFSMSDGRESGLGFNWPHISSTSQETTPDLGRLLYDYTNSSRAFFSTLANQFSQSPAELEAAFRTALSQQTSSTSPQPTRNHLAPLDLPYGGSDYIRKRGFSEPQEPLKRDLHAPSPKRCTVSSLLNFEKDNGSSKWGVSGA